MTVRSTKLVAAGVALAVAAATVPLAPAEAGHRSWGKHHHHHHYHHGHRDRGGQALALAIFGLATGLVVGSALSQPRYYHEPAPRHFYPSSGYGPEPWTSDWYAYCASKYKSFDMYSGMYRTYRGELRFCQ